MYIAVSGNLGSGKSTIARGLADAFNCMCYPRRSYNATYIKDLFREPERWSAEAQISFMVHKQAEIRAGMEQGRIFIVDRTFEEEVQVFAERFYEDGKINDRSIDLIRQLASNLQARLEPPSLIVFCDCPVQVCEDRLKLRPRNYQSAYPPDHLSLLDQKLRAWLGRQSNTPVVMVATDRIDFRDKSSITVLAQQIDSRLRSVGGNQLELFDEEFGSPATDLGRFAKNSVQRASLLRPKQVYLAAPFTARATWREHPNSAVAELFTGREYAESIPPHYRRQLAALANAIQAHGHDVVLPHRDINRWGKRALPAGEIARRCLDAVSRADCFVGLIAESFGSHAELGYALGLGKPALILMSDVEPTSFFGKGMTSLGGVTAIRERSLRKLITVLRTTDPISMMRSEDNR